MINVRSLSSFIFSIDFSIIFSTIFSLIEDLLEISSSLSSKFLFLDKLTNTLKDISESDSFACSFNVSNTLVAVSALEFITISETTAPRSISPSSSSLSACCFVASIVWLIIRSLFSSLKFSILSGLISIIDFITFADNASLSSVEFFDTSATTLLAISSLAPDTTFAIKSASSCDEAASSTAEIVSF